MIKNITVLLGFVFWWMKHYRGLCRWARIEYALKRGSYRDYICTRLLIFLAAYYGYNLVIFVILAIVYRIWFYI